jgi:anti-sigma regulatory factor (Ser/Thr protein kinase)
MEDHVLDVELARETTAPQAARSLVKERFADKLSDQELDIARLLVSELVTNAVIHGRGRITLRARLNEDRLLVDVIDEGSGFEPAVREHGAENPRTGGRGLTIIEAESSRWGTHKGTTHVWFELERPGPRIIGSAPSQVDESV